MDLLIICEPYEVPDNWYVDKSGRAAIYITNKGIQEGKEISLISCEEGFVCIKYNDYVVISVYSSPNSTMQEYDDFLVILTMVIRSLDNRNKLIVMGDFNAKSPEWGSHCWCNRGRNLFQFCGTVDLLPTISKGGVTCEKGRGTKIDLLFGNKKALEMLKESKVIEDYSASDHNYLLHEFRKCRISAEVLSLFDLKGKLDEEKFLESFIRKYGNENLTNLRPCTINIVDDFIMNIGKLVNKHTRFSKPTQGNRVPVPWWTAEIAELRKNANKARRKLTRERTKGNQNNIEVLTMIYKKCKLELNVEIRKAKKENWINLMQEIDTDPWGRPYKCIMKKLKGMVSRPEILNTEEVKDIVGKLFILRPENIDKPIEMMNLPEEMMMLDDDDMDEPVKKEEINVSQEEIEKIAIKMSVKKAPGPDRITSMVTKKIGILASKWFAYIFDFCFKKGYWPPAWKIGRLVLLPKGKTTNINERAYRPLTIISCVAKMLEHVVKGKILTALKTRDFNKNQFGFRKGKSTLDAMKMVLELRKKARSEGRHCLLILLDVKNAFNTVKWSSIIRNLKQRNFQLTLINFINSYLSDRRIIYNGKDGDQSFQVYGGVPQGSVIGPLFWNLVYDELLKIRLRRDVHLIAYADDIGIVIIEKDLEKMKMIAERTIADMSTWYEKEGLSLAHHKTESILLTGRKVTGGLRMMCGNVPISTKDDVKYLGVIVEKNLTYKKHIITVCNKALNYANRLSLLMPNMRGPGNAARRLYYKVVESVIMYAAPIWAAGLNNKGNLSFLRSTQRTALLRVAYAYNSVSADALCVITGQMPLEILIKERETIFEERYISQTVVNEENVRERTKESKERARENSLDQWQLAWDRSINGRWTYTLIPNIREWCTWGPPILSYHVTQILSGHGCFCTFLKKIGKQETDECWFCVGKVDDPAHTLFSCERWALQRETLNMKLGIQLEIDNFIIILKNDKTRDILVSFVKEIMEKKEKIERSREGLTRSGRRGRRKRRGKGRGR